MRSDALLFWLNWQVFSISSRSGIVLYRLVSLRSLVRSLKKRIFYLKQCLYFIFVDLFVTSCPPAADFRSQLMCGRGGLRPGRWRQRIYSALFLLLGLPSTLIRHENGAFRKRSSSWKNLKTPLCVFNRETSVLKFLWRSAALLQQRFSLDYINYDLIGISEPIS